MALLYALSVLCWWRVAAAVGVVSGVAVPLVLLAYPGYALLFHGSRATRSSRPAFALAALLTARLVEYAHAGRSAALGLGVALLVLVRPVGQILVVLAPSLLLGAARGAPDRPRSGCSPPRRSLCRSRLGGPQRRAGRRLHGRPRRRPRASAVPRIRRPPDRRPENGEASRELARVVRDLLPREPYRSYGIDLDTFFASRSARMHEDLIGLSDRPWGWDDDYAHLARVGRVRAHPGTYAARRRARLLATPLVAGLPPAGRPRREAAPRRRRVPARVPPVPSEGQPIPSASVSGFISTPDGRFREVWTSPTAHEIYADDPKRRRAPRSAEPSRRRALEEPSDRQRGAPSSGLVARPGVALVPAACSVRLARVGSSRRVRDPRPRGTADPARARRAALRDRSSDSHWPRTLSRGDTLRSRACCSCSRARPGLASRRPRGAPGPLTLVKLVMTLLAAERGGHRRRPDRVPPARRASTSSSRPTTARTTGRPRSSSATSGPDVSTSSASRRRHAARTVGDAHGSARGDRARRGLGDQLGRRRVLVAARRDAEGRPRAAFRDRYGVVRGCWRHFLPRPDDDPFFAEPDDRSPRGPRSPATSRRSSTLTRRLRIGPIPPSRSSAGNHYASGTWLDPLRGWYPIEVLHFSIAVRSSSSGRRAAAGAGACDLRPSRAPAPPRRGADRGRAADYFDSYVVSDELERGLADGTLAVDTRLRDALRATRVADGRTAARSRSGGMRSSPSARASRTPRLTRRDRLVELDGIVAGSRRRRALDGARGVLGEAPRGRPRCRRLPPR